MSPLPTDTLVDGVASIEDVASRIEDVFAQVGRQLGRGHTMFQELNDDLTAPSGELSVRRSREHQ